MNADSEQLVDVPKSLISGCPRISDTEPLGPPEKPSEGNQETRSPRTFDALVRSLSAIALFTDLSAVSGAAAADSGLIASFRRAPGLQNLTGVYSGIIRYDNLANGIKLVAGETFQEYARLAGLAGLAFQGANFANDLRNGGDPVSLTIKASFDLGAGALFAAGPVGIVTGAGYIVFDFVAPGAIDSGIEYTNQINTDLQIQNLSNGIFSPVPF